MLISPNWAIDVEKKVRRIAEADQRGEKHSAAYWYRLFAFSFIAAWILLYFFEIYITKTPRPMIDSFTAAIGITGALLTTLRFSESYYFWIIQGLAQVILWGITAAQGDAFSSPILHYNFYQNHHKPLLFVNTRTKFFTRILNFYFYISTRINKWYFFNGTRF